MLQPTLTNAELALLALLLAGPPLLLGGLGTWAFVAWLRRRRHRLTWKK